MDYFIRNNETYGMGMARILNECQEAAIHSISQPSVPIENIHMVRRHLKMIRAALRLLRMELGRKNYKKENLFYRNQARKLSGVRDLSVMLETVDFLRPYYKKAYKGKTPFSLENKLRTALSKSLKKDMGVFHEVSNSLLAHKTEKWEALNGNIAPDNCVYSLAKAYKSGHRCFHLSLESPSPKATHQWRKQAKYLRYQVQIIEGAWPAILKPWKKELHHLTDYLGDSNNLSVLISYLEGQKANVVTAQKKKWKHIAERKRKQLDKKALALGKKLYAERPSAFAKRINRYIEDWEAFHD